MQSLQELLGVVPKTLDSLLGMPSPMEKLGRLLGTSSGPWKYGNYTKGYVPPKYDLGTSAGSVKFMAERVMYPIALADFTYKAAKNIIDAKKGFDKDIEAQSESGQKAYDMEIKLIKTKRK
jgi:hypothetical protein